MFRFIFYTVIIGIILTGLMLIAGTGIYNIPYVTKLLKADKPLNLGVAKDRVYFEDLLHRADVKLNNDLNEYCLNCQMVYGNYKNVSLTITSEEFSSLLDVMNNSFIYPLSNIQIKLDSDNQAELSAYVDLTKYGYELKGPIYLQAKVKNTGNRFDIHINKAKFGILPIPEKYIPKVEKELNNLVSDRLQKIKEFSIKEFNIEDGNIYFQGNIPGVISVKK